MNPRIRPFRPGGTSYSHFDTATSRRFGETDATTSVAFCQQPGQYHGMVELFIYGAAFGWICGTITVAAMRG